LLAEGASLESIAVLLRHRSLDTTAHYAKVDMKRLGKLAQPWPEVSPC
jgi:site-specific recombinase XerD